MMHPRSPHPRAPPSRQSLSPFPIQLLFLLSLGLFQLALPASAAFTTAVSRDGDYIEANSKGDFCYYPASADPASLDVACTGPTKGDFARVMDIHLNTTLSIGYYSASLERLGGASYAILAQADLTTSRSSSTQSRSSTRSSSSRAAASTAASATRRKIYLCVSGRAGDYTYRTTCTTVTKDNSLGDGAPKCSVMAGQKRVTDGCYIPNQNPPVVTVVGGAATSRVPVVTVTRTGSGSSAAAARSTNGASGLGVRRICLSVSALTLGALAWFFSPI